MKSIEEQWDEYAAMVFANTPAGPVQRAETKKAFFAGAWSLFCALEEIGQPHVSEEQGEEFLEKWRAECLEFKRRLLDEYAQQN